VVKKISRWTKQHEIELIWGNPHYLLQIEPVFQFGVFYR